MPQAHKGLPKVTAQTIDAIFAVYAGKKWGTHLNEAKDRFIRENPHLIRFLEGQIGKYPPLLHSVLFEIAMGAITLLEHQALVDESAMESMTNNTDNQVISGKPKKRGLGAMDKEKVRLITSLGGKTAHAMGRGHEWTSAEARRAGRQGGKALKGSRWSRLK